MARSMPTASNARKVSRPAQGDNKGMREDPKWRPRPQAAPAVVSTGTQSRPSDPRWNPKPQPGPGKITTVGPAS